MKRPLLLLPVLAALAALVLLLWMKRPSAPVTPSYPAAQVLSHDSHEHTAPPEPASPKAPSTPSTTGGLLVRVTARGVPLPGAEVLLVRDNPEGRMTFQTGSDGTRLITQLPPGEFALSASHPRFISTHAHLAIPAGPPVTHALDLQSGARVFGRVTDLAGNPLGNASASLMDAQNGGTSSQNTVKTDANGRYEILLVPPGDYGVRFKHEKFKGQERLGLPAIRGTEEVEVNAALELGAKVAGRVLDDGGVPLAGAQVIFGNEGGGGLHKTDAEGRFTIHGLTEAPVSGSASLKGYGTVYRRGVPPNTLDIEFRMSKGGTLAGRLLVDPLPEHFTVSLSRFDVLPAAGRLHGRRRGGRDLLDRGGIRRLRSERAAADHDRGGTDDAGRDDPSPEEMNERAADARYTDAE